MPPASVPRSERCAVHPARPAVDLCPVCGAPRCGNDAAAAPGGGCLACQGGAAAATPVAEVPFAEGLIRAALAALPVAVVGGAVTSEYVGTGAFAVITPFLLGVACGAASIAAAGRVSRPAGLRWVRLVGVLFALIGTAYGYRFVVGGEDPFGPAGSRIGPYVAAAVGAWLWTVPPRRRRRGR